jgi:succinate dehydrogenase cytochrome b subunit
MQSTRPIYLDLRRIKLPIGGWVSILHRLSGVLLVLAIPAGALLLAQALSGPDGFAASTAVLAHPLVRLALVVLLWSLLHHLLAGIRYLLLDLGLGLARASARRSACAALLGALAAAALILGTGVLGTGVPA